MENTHTHNATSKIEKIGFYLSLACAIHCIATPLIMTLLPFIGGHLFANHQWEIGFIAVSVVLAGNILYSDFQKHQNILPLLLLLGSVFVKVAEILWLGEKYEFVTGSLGAMLIAVAYYTNWKYKATCNC